MVSFDEINNLILENKDNSKSLKEINDNSDILIERVGNQYENTEKTEDIKFLASYQILLKNLMELNIKSYNLEWCEKYLFLYKDIYDIVKKIEGNTSETKFLETEVYATQYRMLSYFRSKLPNRVGEHKQDKYADAIGFAEESLVFASATNNSVSQSKSYGILGSVYHDALKFYDAYSNHKASIRVFNFLDTDEKKERAAKAYYNLAALYLEIQSYDVASENASKAIELINEIGSSAIDYELVKAGIPLLKIGLKSKDKFSDSDKVDIKNAIKITDSIINSKNEIQNKEYIEEAMLLRANYYYINEEYDNALSVYENYTESDIINEAKHLKTFKCIKCSCLAKQGKTKQAYQLYDELYEDFENDKFKSHMVITMLDAMKSLNEANDLGSNTTDTDKELPRQAGLENENIDLYRTHNVYRNLIKYLKKQNYTWAKNKIYRDRIDNRESILQNILPIEIADKLINKEKVEPKRYDSASILFTDFVGFSSIAEDIGEKELLEQLEVYFEIYDDIITKFKVEKIKTIGDSYLIASGLPIEDTANKHAVNATKAAIAILYATKLIKEKKENNESSVKLDKIVKPFDIRLGINSGPVIAGIVGSQRYAYDVWGETVNVASRVEQGDKEEEDNKLYISEHTYNLLNELNLIEYKKDDTDETAEINKFIFLKWKTITVKGTTVEVYKISHQLGKKAQKIRKKVDKIVNRYLDINP